MHYSFYADESDKLKILEFIFSETDLKLFEPYSPYGETTICEYKSAQEIAKRLDLHSGSKFAAGFQLWSPTHGGPPLISEFELNPKYCNGHTIRAMIRGWGLIQLHFGGVDEGGLNESAIVHFNKAGALRAVIPERNNDDVEAWDWTQIAVSSRKLKYHIQKRLAVRTDAACGVLAGADKLVQEGIILR